jgi:hypothetical protein
VAHDDLRWGGIHHRNPTNAPAAVASIATSGGSRAW